MENYNFYGYEYIKDYKYHIFGHSKNDQKTVNDFFILNKFVDLFWVNNKISRKLWRQSWNLHPNNEKTRLNWFQKSVKKMAKRKRQNGNTSALIKYPQLLDKLVIKNGDDEKIFSFLDGSKFELDFVMPRSKPITEFDESDYSSDMVEVSINEFLYNENKRIVTTEDGNYKRPVVWGHIYSLNKKGKRNHGTKIVVKIPLEQIKELLVKLTRISNSLNDDNIARLIALDTQEELTNLEMEAITLATKEIVKKSKNHKSKKNKIKEQTKQNLTYDQLVEKQWNKALINQKQGILNDSIHCYCASRGLLDVDIGNHFPDCPNFQKKKNDS